MRAVEPPISGASTSSRSEIASSAGNGSCLRRWRAPSRAALRPTRISQAVGSRGGPVLRPALQRPQAGVLERFFGRVRGRENSAAGRDRLGPSGGEGAWIHSISVMRRRRRAGRDCKGRSGDLIGAAGIGGGEIARDFERLVEIGDVDDVKPSNCSFVSANGRRSPAAAPAPCAAWWPRCRQQAQRWAELARLDQTVLDDFEPGHDRGPPLAPGPDNVSSL